MKHLARRSLALLAGGVLAVSACSDNSTGPKPNSSMTQQEALAVASALMAEISKASPASAAARNVAPASASFSVMPTTVTFTSDCTNGGKISGSADYTSTVNTAGTGSVTAVLTVTPQACKVSNGTKLITVGGQMTFDFSLNLNQNTVVGNIVWHGKGNLTWDDGNCNIDYTVTASPTTGHGSVTGTFCGASLNSTV
jgi:hypothetical protein